MYTTKHFAMLTTYCHAEYKYPVFVIQQYCMMSLLFWFLIMLCVVWEFIYISVSNEIMFGIKENKKEKEKCKMPFKVECFFQVFCEYQSNWFNGIEEQYARVMLFVCLCSMGSGSLKMWFAK